ncbi:FeoA family protein [Botrimarina sp.]|uniref:FeoA family protein n=1 Tax=Botrimarina sp. TaxID=2795802 RepID=UPI0032ECB94A
MVALSSQSPAPLACGNEAPLSQLARGGHGRVTRVVGDSAESVRLRALGFCQGRRVEVLRTGPTWVVRVLGSRIGLSRELASSVLLTAA